MPIRRRSISTAIVAPVVDDNVINERALDERGVFDPKRDPFDGSIVGYFAGPDPDARAMRNVLPVAFNAGQKGLQHRGDDIPVQDALAFVRIMDNPGENVEMTYRNRVRSPLTGIRGFCVHTCKAGSPKAVGRCDKLSCPLWPFRMGKHGLR